MTRFQMFSSTVMIMLGIGSTSVWSQPERLATLQVMAEPELRQEVGFIPYQEDRAKRKALQHRIMQIQQDTQNRVIDPDPPVLITMPAKEPVNMDHLSPALQQHILAIAAGLQSDNPLRGLETLLAPFRGPDGQIQLDLPNISLGVVDYEMNLGNSLFPDISSQLRNPTR
ncbi:hypothetical protein NI401_03995 [Acinetobacter indicus]|uniref:hypothetical protein n=1 Tax=Acinetobacter indicus TaxID=756892 RepID=UPI00209B2D64|nr:hypothetical protein [Acinetobacter indicus]MCO8102076.1 hypothetical protein [Acinetobacter indicus]